MFSASSEPAAPVRKRGTAARLEEPRSHSAGEAVGARETVSGENEPRK